MPSRVYYFSKQSIDRDGKQKKAIPNSQWKGPGAYYLRGNKGDRYWAIDMVSKGHKYLYDGFYQKCNHYWTPNGATWKGIG